MSLKISTPFIAAIDFGTSNSGVVWSERSDKVIDEAHYANTSRRPAYAKTRTALLVHQSLLDKLDSLTIDDIKFGKDANVYFGNDALEQYLKEKGGDPNWRYFQYFKMGLYNESSPHTRRPVAYSIDGKEYDLTNIICLFLLCLRKNAAGTILESVGLSDKDVTWAVTIPTIWDDSAKSFMGEVCRRVFSNKPIFILEPEGAAMSFAYWMANSIIEVGDYFLVIDCGGGTSDIVIQHAIRDSNGSVIYEEIKTACGEAKAGWAIDEKFWEYFAEKLASYAIGTISHPFGDLIVDYRQDPANRRGWFEMVRAWEEVKCAETRDDTHYIFIPSQYLKWLERNFPAIYARYMEENEGKYDYALIFTQNELEQYVYFPIVKEIVSLASKVANGVELLDHIFLAGGLSGLKELDQALREKFKQTHPDANFYCESTLPPDSKLRMYPGGSIMRGAAILMVHDKSIIRRVKRNYYYSTNINPKNFDIENAEDYFFYDIFGYRKITGKYTLDEKLIEDLQKELNDSGYIDRCMHTIEGITYLSVLRPICIIGGKAGVFNSGSLTALSEEQTSVRFNFYSSDTNHFLFPCDRNIDTLSLRHEGSIEVKCDGLKDSFVIRVDFNDFAQEHFDFQVFNAETNELLDKKNVQIEIGLGH